MLRLSSQREGFEANLDAVMTDDADPGVTEAALLRELTESTIQGNWSYLEELRVKAVSALGAQSTADALSVASGFNGITRVADATGIPIDGYEDDVGQRMRTATGIDKFHYSEKTNRYDVPANV